MTTRLDLDAIEASIREGWTRYRRASCTFSNDVALDLIAELRALRAAAADGGVAGLIEACESAQSLLHLVAYAGNHDELYSEMAMMDMERLDLALVAVRDAVGEQGSHP